MKIFAFALTHLAVFLGAWVMAGRGVEEVKETKPMTSSARVIRAAVAGVTLSDYLARTEVRVSKYEILKGELAPINDYPKVVGDLIKQLPKDYLRAWNAGDDPEAWYRLPDPAGPKIAEFEVRVRQWLSVDREECLEFLKSSPNGNLSSGGHAVYENAFADYALEEDAEEWVFQNRGGKTKVYRARLAEMGTADFLAKYGGKFSDGGESLVRVYGEMDFADRDLILQSIVEAEGRVFKKHQVLKRFLANTSHPDAEMLAWIREVREGGSIPDALKKESDRIFNDWLGRNAEAPFEERLQLASEMDGVRGSMGNMMRESVGGLLDEGRDWRYEFQHGRVEVGEVFADLQSRLSADEPEMVESLRSHLFYELVGEDPVRAQELLTPLSESRRREVQRRALGMGFAYRDPLLAKAYYDSLPEPQSVGERKVNEQNWGWQVEYGLARHGDDFVDWAAALPEGNFKETTVEKIREMAERRSGGILDRVRKEFGE